MRIGPDMRMVVVGAPSYFAGRTPPDQTNHSCINLRLRTRGNLYAWEFEKAGRETKIRVEGQHIFNTVDLMFDAASAGLGLAYLSGEHVQRSIASGRLVQVLGDWCPPFPRYHLYYPSRRHRSAAFSMLVDALRYREPANGGRASS